MTVVSIPLKSGRCCKYLPSPIHRLSVCLNPFEVREVLQALDWLWVLAPMVSIPLKSGRCCKGLVLVNNVLPAVSIPLKSGRCCKNECQQRIGHNCVSIPLKSGRCCKQASVTNQTALSLNPFEVREVLQVLGFLLRTTQAVSIPLKSGRCCKTCCFGAHLCIKRLNPFEVREVLQVVTS